MTTQMNAIFAVLLLVLFGFVFFFNILSKILFLTLNTLGNERMKWTI